MGLTDPSAISSVPHAEKAGPLTSQKHRSKIRENGCKEISVFDEEWIGRGS